MLKRVKNLIARKKQTEAEGISILHPRDLNLHPVKSEYILQYRIRRGRWKDVPAHTHKLPHKPLRMWRKDTYRVGEGFRSSEGQVVVNGTYTSFEYLGKVNRDTFNMHRGEFTPELLDTTPHEKKPSKTYGKPRGVNTTPA